MALDRRPIIQRLSQITDPELGLDIISLGLVYDLSVASKGLTVLLTLTFPGCPLSGYFQEQVRAALKDLTEYQTVNVKITFEPPWSVEMIDSDARLGLGFASNPAPASNVSPSKK